jgi:glycosyltransferase involved in cell wall biosynthesis
VYVQASRWEGMALPLLQAMAMGMPCVVTDVVGNRDAISNGKTGLVARDLSALAVQVNSLLDDAGLAQALGEAARVEARQRFHPLRFRRSLLSLYRLADGLARSPHGALDTAPS